MSIVPISLQKQMEGYSNKQGCYDDGSFTALNWAPNGMAPLVPEQNMSTQVLLSMLVRKLCVPTIR